MRVLELTVASIIEGFLEYEPRDAFAVDHSQTIKQLQTPVWVGGNDYKTFESIQDAAIVFEVAGFIERLEAWSREVCELREQFFYDTMTSYLPEPFEKAFGYTSNVVFEYQNLVQRSKMLVRILYSRNPEVSHESKKAVMLRKAIDLRNTTDHSWDAIAAELSQKAGNAFEDEVREFAKHHGLTIRKSKPGRKPKKVD